MAIYKLVTGKANSQDNIPNGKYPLYDRSNNIKRSDIFILDGAFTIIPGEGIFEPKYIDGKFNLHQRAYAICSNVFLPKYLFYLLTKKSKLFYKYAVGSTVPSLRASSFVLTKDLDQQKIIDIIEPKEKLYLKYSHCVQIHDVDVIKHDIKELIDIIEPLEILEEKLKLLEDKINIIVKKLPSLKFITLSKMLKPIKYSKKNLQQISAKVLNKRSVLPICLENPNTYKTNTFFTKKKTLIINTIRTYLEKFAIVPYDCDSTGTLAHFEIIDGFNTSVLSTLLNNNFWNSIIKYSKGTKMPIVSKKDILKIMGRQTIEIPHIIDIYISVYLLREKTSFIKNKFINLLIK